MARPQKEGLDYFPLDVDFFSNRKIKALMGRFGAQGVTYYLYLLCEIYREHGYYLQTDDDFDYIISAEPVFDSFGHLTYIVKSAIDMTEFNELLSSRTALNTCLETLIGEPELEKALEKVLQTLCAHLGASRACIFRFDEDAHTMSAQVEYMVLVTETGVEVLTK